MSHSFVAAVPQVWIDLGTVAGVVSALGVALRLLWNTAPVRWFRASVSRSFGEWVQVQVRASGVDALRSDFDEHRQYVSHHLGPNGSTRPIYRRLILLEEAHDIEGGDLSGVDGNV